MNQVHFASVEDEDDDMYSGFNDLSATDITQVSCTHNQWLVCQVSHTHIETDRNSVSISAPKLAIFLVSVTAVIVKHGFGLLSVTAETTMRFRPEPKLSLLVNR